MYNIIITSYHINSIHPEELSLQECKFERSSWPEGNFVVPDHVWVPPLQVEPMEKLTSKWSLSD